MDCLDKDTFLKDFVTSYKEICAAGAAEEEGLDVSASDAICIRSSVLDQPPKIDLSKNRSPVLVVIMVEKLKRIQKCCGAGTSKD